jgi:outer membrane lipoprotein carrier protein
MYHLKILLSISAGVLALSFSTVAFADAALDTFIKRLEVLSSMETHFEQVTMDQSGEVLQSLSGTLTVARPGKMRWQTEPPYEQLVVSDGELVWVYDMDLEQVTIRELEAKLQDTPALLLSGNTGEIEANYQVTHPSVAGDEGIDRYLLKPLDRSQLFDALEFDYKGDNLAYMRIFDAAGQITEIRFTEQRLNPELDDQAFYFIVPEGVDVIDGRHGR